MTYSRRYTKFTTLCLQPNAHLYSSIIPILQQERSKGTHNDINQSQKCKLCRPIVKPAPRWNVQVARSNQCHAIPYFLPVPSYPRGDMRCKEHSDPVSKLQTIQEGDRKLHDCNAKMQSLYPLCKVPGCRALHFQWRIWPASLCSALA